MPPRQGKAASGACDVARPTVPPGPRAPRSQRCRSAAPVWRPRATDAGGVGTLALAVSLVASVCGVPVPQTRVASPAHRAWRRTAVLLHSRPGRLAGGQSVWRPRAADAGGVTHASGLAPHRVLPLGGAVRAGNRRGRPSGVAPGGPRRVGVVEEPKAAASPTRHRGEQVRRDGGLPAAWGCGPAGGRVGRAVRRHGAALCQHLRPTRACRRPPIASARASLRLSAAPEAWR